MAHGNDRIKVSKAEMQKAISRYEGIMSDIQKAFGMLEDAKANLDKCYGGSAYIALTAKWLDTYANVRSAEKAITESIEGLNKTVSTMVDVEDVVGTAGAGLGKGEASTTYRNGRTL